MIRDTWPTVNIWSVRKPTMSHRRVPVPRVPLRLPSRQRRRRVAVIVDGPNMLRKELGVDLEEVSKVASELGSVRLKVVVLDRKAPEKLVEAVMNAGYKALISPGKPEVDFTIAAMDSIHDDKIDALALVTRSAAYISLVYRAKEAGKEVAVIGAEPGFSVALRKAADASFTIGTPSPPDESAEEE